MKNQTKTKSLSDKKEKRRLKRQAKKDKKLSKQQKRAAFYKKHFVIRWLLRFVYWLLIVTSFYVVYRVVDTIYHLYQRTNKWEKISNTPMSSLTTFELYATDKQKKSMESYKKTLNEIWNNNQHQFTSKVNEQKMNKLVKNYESLGDLSKNFETSHAEVMDMWSVESKLNSLFKNSSRTEFKSDVSLGQISTTLTDSFNTLSNYLIRDNSEDYRQVHKYKDEIFKIADETHKMYAVLEDFSTHYQFSDENGKLVVKTDLLESQFADLKEKVNSLTYKWDIINIFISDVISRSQKTITLNEMNESKFIEYTVDLSKKQEYESYKQLYLEALSDIRSKIVELPDFKNKTLKDVEKWSRDNGMILKVVRESNSLPKDVVMSQDPTTSSFDKIVKGSVFTITVSDGEEKTTTIMTSSSSETPTTTSTTTTSPRYSIDE